MPAGSARGQGLRDGVDEASCLVIAKADMKAKSADGETAMSLAAKGGFSGIVQLLKASLPE